MVGKNITDIKTEVLKNFWGYDSFRENQEAIIDSILSGTDTLALLPTGGGKSICYQLPSLILEGTCLVISPLLALMKDQVSQLKYNGIEAEYLSSELDEIQEEHIYLNCKNGITKLLYISPERLNNQKFLREIEEIAISFIAVDEAHCISEWGQDFRPSFQNIKGFREQFKNVPILALTATATPLVVEEIQIKLNLKTPKVFQKSFRRNNLKIIHKEISDKKEFLKNYIHYNQKSGLVYVRTRKESENIVEFLKSFGISNVDYYHAGLSLREKNEKQKNWLHSDSKVLVCTNAFGMGIDKDNVRFVIHYSSPPSIENYYQEIGRAGRAGQSSETILLWNGQEIYNFDSILNNQMPDRTGFIKLISYLYSIFQIADGEKSDNTFSFDFQRVKKFTNQSTASIKNVLGFLHNQEIIYYTENKTLSSVELNINASEIDSLIKKDSYFIELLLRNLPGIQTQKIHFNELNLCKKLGLNPTEFKQRIFEIHNAGHLNYIDGTNGIIKFLEVRDDNAISGKQWNLFLGIQKNKLQKWEEMKYFIRENNVCKMKMILAYFGEQKSKSCGICSNCLGSYHFFKPKSVSEEIKNVLKNSPAGLEEISMKLQHHPKQTLLENLILLLDTREVVMVNFRTYALA